MNKEDKKESELLGSPKTLVDLVKYQPGAVVSRTLIDKKPGTVTLFAFAKGESLSEHTTPFKALAYMLDGTAHIRIGEHVHPVEQGEMLIIPANKPHTVKAKHQFKMLLTMIRE